jgi:hypothetical protein
MSAQAETLKQKAEELKKHGLEDVKFCFGPLAEKTADEVYSSINEVLDAIARADYVDFPDMGESRKR